MRKILYGILLTGISFVGCTDLDDPVTEKYGNGPSVSIDITATADSTFTFTVTPGTDTQFYSFIVAKQNAAQELNSYTLLKGGYSGLAGSVVDAAKTPTYTFDMRSKGQPLGLPNTTYQIYAVAASDKGITGEVANVSVTTKDSNDPKPASMKADPDTKSVAVTFAEQAVAAGSGKVTAKYYKEWDITNPEDLDENEFTVTIENNIVTFAAPDTPAGATVSFSWEAGAFVDSAGNPCAAQESGINMSTGRFTGVYVSNSREAFALTDDNITAPEIGSTFSDWSQFVGEITLDFPIFRNDNTVEAGDLRVIYTNASKETSVKLDATNWMINGDKLLFELPEAPQYGDYVSLLIVEGAFTDVYGNPNAEFEIEEAWLYSYNYKREMVIGDYIMSYSSYFDGTPYTENISITAGSSENGVILSGFLTAGSNPVEGVFDGDYATIKVPTDQLLIETADSEYYLVNGENGDYITYHVAANGNLSTSDVWGYFVVDPDDEGYYDAATGADLVKQPKNRAFASSMNTRNFDLSNITLRTLNRK